VVLYRYLKKLLNAKVVGPDQIMQIYVDGTTELKQIFELKVKLP
jgi:hypothetical protein